MSIKDFEDHFKQIFTLNGIEILDKRDKFSRTNVEYLDEYEKISNKYFQKLYEDTIQFYDKIIEQTDISIAVAELSEQKKELLGKQGYPIPANNNEFRYFLGIYIMTKLIDKIIDLLNKKLPSHTNFFKAFGIIVLIIIILTGILYLANIIINIIMFLIKSDKAPSFWYIFAGPLGTYYFL